MKLSPATNIRSITPRACATCCYRHVADSLMVCKRPNGPVLDVEGNSHWFTVCDKYKYGSDGEWTQEEFDAMLDLREKEHKANGRQYKR